MVLAWDNYVCVLQFFSISEESFDILQVHYKLYQVTEDLQQTLVIDTTTGAVKQASDISENRFIDLITWTVSATEPENYQLKTGELAIYVGNEAVRWYLIPNN